MRFFAGGLAVSIFALLGDVLRPKSFAGLLGAAPSVALATITLAFASHGLDYVATEARSMAIGALAFALFSATTCQLLMRLRQPAWAASSAALLVWVATAFALLLLMPG